MTSTCCAGIHRVRSTGRPEGEVSRRGWSRPSIAAACSRRVRRPNIVPLRPRSPEIPAAARRCHDMLGSDGVRGCRTRRNSGPDIDGAGAKARHPAVMRSKSTSCSNVCLSALVSYQLVASSVPLGCNHGVTGRAEKNPFAPHARAKIGVNLVEEITCAIA